jgi:hypothetical protein
MLDPMFEEIAQQIVDKYGLSHGHIWRSAQASSLGGDLYSSVNLYEYGPDSSVFVAAARVVCGSDGDAWTGEQLLNIIWYSNTRRYHIDRAREFLTTQSARDRMWSEVCIMDSDGQGEMKFLAMACLAQIVSGLVPCRGVITY